VQVEVEVQEVLSRGQQASDLLLGKWFEVLQKDVSDGGLLTLQIHNAYLVRRPWSATVTALTQIL
jgi:hypothetical protein